MIIWSSYKGWRWNDADLMSAKQAFLGLLQDGADLDELMAVGFGNLDCIEVAREYLNSF